MNWLHTYGAMVDCEDIKVILKDEKEKEGYFYGQREEISCPWISDLKASKLLCHGRMGYWCYAIDTHAKEKKAGNILVFCKFEDVCLEESPGLPRHREIDFGIELILMLNPFPKPHIVEPQLSLRN